MSDAVDAWQYLLVLGSCLIVTLPLEVIGAHVASERSKTTGRRHDLSLRLAIALFGHQGIEWDISLTSSEERRSLAEWISLAKSLRPLLHGGELVRMERPGDPGTAVFGLVAQDRSEALFALVRSHAGPQTETLPVRLGGLDPKSCYLVKRLSLPGEISPEMVDIQSGARATEGAVRGSILMIAGIPAPAMSPESAVLFHLQIR